MFLALASLALAGMQTRLMALSHNALSLISKLSCILVKNAWSEIAVRCLCTSQTARGLARRSAYFQEVFIRIALQAAQTKVIKAVFSQ